MSVYIYIYIYAGPRVARRRSRRWGIAITTTTNRIGITTTINRIAITTTINRITIITTINRIAIDGFFHFPGPKIMEKGLFVLRSRNNVEHPPICEEDTLASSKELPALSSDRSSDKVGSTLMGPLQEWNEL